MRIPATKKNIWTRLDETGALFSTPRLPSESLSSYKRRLLLYYVDALNSTREGMENAILSGLGLSRVRAASCSLVSGVDSADFPHRKFIKTDNRVLIFKHYLSDSDYVLDCEIELRERPYYNIPDLVDLINARSSLYTASLLTQETLDWYGSEKYMKLAKASTISNYDNLQLWQEYISSQKATTLTKKNIVKGTLSFTDTVTYEEELLSEDLLDNNVPGSYYIDYDTGMVKTVSTPAAGCMARYFYIEEPFSLFHSPISVTQIFSTEAEKYLFEELQSMLYTTEEERTYAGHSKQEMLDLAYELLNVSKVYWAK